MLLKALFRSLNALKRVWKSVKEAIDGEAGNGPVTSHAGGTAKENDHTWAWRGLGQRGSLPVYVRP